MAKTIEEIDRNFKIEHTFALDDLQLYDVRKEPFDLYGFYNAKTEPAFKRLPDEIAAAISEGVVTLAKHTAGGRVRFTTDSSYIALKSVMPSVSHMPHMPLTGSSGFDLYLDQGGQATYAGTFMPPYDMTGGYESVIRFPDRKRRSLTIHFPLYNEVTALYVGLQSDALLEHGVQYTYNKPVLFYGSSITQGGCASRPGNCYENIISEKLDCNHLNLGFSGSARGEDVIVDFMNALDFSIFVSDYDHNAPDVEFLKNTHEKMFLKIRAAHPDTPVVFMTKPDFENGRDVNILRRDVVYQTYLNAVRRGDRNVTFIDGEKLFANTNRDACTVDGCHPNDAGFVRMAEVVGATLSGLLRNMK